MNRTLKSSLIFGLCITLVFSSLYGASKKGEASEKTGRKNFTGWIDGSNKDVVVKNGNIKINIYTKLGSFNISAINENGKAYPIFYNGNESTSTGLFLKVNNKVYRLGNESNVKTIAKTTETGCQITYSIKEVADVLLDLSFVETAPGNGADMVKITATVTNHSSKRADFALKMVMDTVLGESGTAHFFTSSDIPVKAEVMYRTKKNEKWFVSRNTNAQMQILLDGADITSPEIVALANYSTLEKNTWEPEMLSYRSFDTVLSYNNSAVGIIWPQKKLLVDASNTNCFYIALATGADKPAGEEFLAGYSQKKEISVPELSFREEKTAEEEKKTAKTPKPKNHVSVTVEPEVIEASPDSNKTVEKPVNSKLNEAQLSPEYIQALIDRIETLQKNPDQASKVEIELLNQELDAILEALM